MSSRHQAEAKKKLQAIFAYHYRLTWESAQQIYMLMKCETFAFYLMETATCRKKRDIYFGSFSVYFIVMLASGRF